MLHKRTGGSSYIRCLENSNPERWKVDGDYLGLRKEGNAELRFNGYRVSKVLKWMVVMVAKQW